MKAIGRCVAALCLLACGLPAVLSCQTITLQNIADGVSLDSLRNHIRCLADDSTFALGDSVYRIRGRRDSTGRKIARLYLKAKLDSYGLTTRLDTFGVATDYSIAQVNVLAEQPGTVEPAVSVIISAHYDAIVSGNAQAPGADDNATGVAAVLEAARILSRHPTRYTVIYALWDLEETGLEGSAAFARRARSRMDSIRGVINIDMIGWDSVETSGCEIFVRAYGQSQQLGDSLMEISRRVQTGITPTIIDPAMLGSDHRSFWQKGYSAVCLTEQFATVNRSPYYHLSSDRIEHINFHSLYGRTCLAVASIAWLAGFAMPTDVPPEHTRPVSAALFQNYPNPFNPHSDIRYQISDFGMVRLAVHDVLGREVAMLVNEKKEPGSYTVRFDGSNLSSGMYFYRLQTGGFTETRKLILLR